MPQCKCCTLERPAVNRHGLCPECAVCLHCDRRRAVSRLGLCRCCQAQPGLRRLYRRSSKAPWKWSPAREQRVRLMTRHYGIARIRKELNL